jgi:hypothetical protein
VLGIHTEALPAMAMNTADGRVLTFDAAGSDEGVSALSLPNLVRM